MLALSAETLTILAVLIVAAIAAGTLTARFFIAASRVHSGSEKKI